jgi:hypothetical protein
MENEYLNYQMEELKMYIKRTIGGAQLPIGITVYILKDILKEMEDLYYNRVQEEQARYVAFQKELQEMENQPIEEESNQEEENNE